MALGFMAIHLQFCPKGIEYSLRHLYLQVSVQGLGSDGPLQTLCIGAYIGTPSGGLALKVQTDLTFR